MSTTKLIKLEGWPKGIISKRENLFDFPVDALVYGENVDLMDGCIKTRFGSTLPTQSGLPAGEIVALTQVRFPTNEVSYLVAQVKYLLFWQQGTGTGPGPREYHSAVWDTGNSRMLVFGGDGFGKNDLWAYDPAVDVWTELAPTGGPPHVRIQHRAIYVPSTELMFIFGGCYYDGGLTDWIYLNDLWIYDCQADTWTEQATSGDVPPLIVYPSGGGAGPNWSVYRSSNSTMLVGDDTTYYSLNLTTWVWTEHTITGDAFGNPHTASYDYDTESLILAGYDDGGGTILSRCWVVDLATDVSNRVTDGPWPNNLGDVSSSVYCSGLFYAFGYESNPGSFMGWSYAVGTDTWTEIVWQGATPPLTYGETAVLSDTSEILIFGGSAVDDKVWGTSEVCSSTGAYGYSLYACPDHLPTG